MTQSKKAVYFFCAHSVDHVAGHVFEAVRKLHGPGETDILVDRDPVLRYTDERGDSFWFVRTERVVSHDFTHYLPIMQRYFSDFDFAGIITWHAGENAPDNILTTHTTGDVDSGSFGPANPGYMRNLLLAMERSRVEAGLDSYRTTTEATHWSGMVYGGGTPDLIPQYPVPVLDIEIGSSPDCWSNPTAAAVLATSLFGVFTGDGRKARRLLCAGGVHFEPSFAAAALQTWDDWGFAVSHILANQWLVTGRYENDDGPERLEACVRSIAGGIDGIAFHDNLKGVYKDRFRALGAKLGVPAFKHQTLRHPETIAWADRLT